MNAAAWFVCAVVLATMPQDRGEGALARAPVAASATGPRVRSTVGIEGQVIFRHPATESVQAVPVNDKAPVVVRIARSTPDGSFILYDLRFIAQYSGEFDLRDCLRRPDGAPLTDALPLPVVVDRLLPDDHQGELFRIDGLSLPQLGGYRVALIAIGVLWLVPPAWLLVRRLTRRVPPPPPPAPTPATLAAQLRPLVEAAIAGSLSTPDRARLELLLLAYWRERLGIGAEGLNHVAAIRKLREHREAGELLGLLERWLHRPPTGTEEVDIGAVLERYRAARPVDLAAPAGVGA